MVAHHLLTPLLMHSTDEASKRRLLSIGKTSASEIVNDPLPTECYSLSQRRPSHPASLESSVRVDDLGSGMVFHLRDWLTEEVQVK